MMKQIYAMYCDMSSIMGIEPVVLDTFTYTDYEKARVAYSIHKHLNCM